MLQPVPAETRHLARAAAALSVRGLATALVVLRGALIRTGIGAFIVGAGELFYQSTRLVAATGGIGAATVKKGSIPTFAAHVAHGRCRAKTSGQNT